MPVPDSPDFQLTINVVAVPSADNPDWQVTAVGPGGAPIGGGYKSLTGPGETATPGDLIQAGGFKVDDSVGDSVQLTSSGTGGVYLIDGGGIWGLPQPGVHITEDNTGPIEISQAGDGDITIENVTAVGNTAILANAAGGTLTISSTGTGFNITNNGSVSLVIMDNSPGTGLEITDNTPGTLTIKSNGAGIALVAPPGTITANGNVLG